jgi:hypothetical protein
MISQVTSPCISHERIKQKGWQEINVFLKMTASVRAKILKRKKGLIEFDVTRDIYSTRIRVKTLETLVKRTISEKGALF